ncbi:MAG: CHASE4 domain-containing protein, partial [Sphingobium sp.]
MTVLRRVPGQYLWPLLILIGLCFGSILTLLYFTTSSQDRMEAARQTRTLSAALDTNVAMVAHDLQDYAKWDEAVRHITLHFDANWIDDNVTAYLGRTQGYSHVLVIGPDNRSRYIFTDGKLSHTDPVAGLGRTFADSVKAVRDMRGDRQPILSGFTRQGGHLYIYSVAAIVPLTNKIGLPPGERQVLAIAEEVDGAFIDRIRKTHQLPPLTIRADGGVAAFRDFRGRPLAW